MKTNYYPYGYCRNSTGTLGTDKLFTGQRLDDTGLYYYGARYYDPTIGRFISPDSLVPSLSDPQAFNRYSYVYNNPLRYTDPTGQFGWEDVKKAATVIMGGLQVAGSKVVETYNKVRDSTEQAVMHAAGIEKIENITHSGSDEPVRVWTASDSGLNAINKILDVFDAEGLTPGPDTILLREDTSEMTREHEFAHIGQARELEQQGESYLGEYIGEYTGGVLVWWSLDEAYIYHPMEWEAREETGQYQPEEPPTPFWEDIWDWFWE